MNEKKLMSMGREIMLLFTGEQSLPSEKSIAFSQNWFRLEVVFLILAISSIQILILTCSSPNVPQTVPCPPDPDLWATGFPPKYGVKSIHFVNQTTGWAIATSSLERSMVILKTTDKGDSWHTVVTKSPNLFGSSVFFVNEAKGWVVGDNGTIKYTENGGCSWSAQISNTNANLADVFFRNEMEGWVVGGTVSTSCDGYGLILQTTNGGNTWSECFSTQEGVLMSVDFKGNLGCAVGGGFLDNFCKQLVVRTTDRGKNWSPQPTGIIGPLTSVRFLDSLVGVATGWGYDITTDGGVTWKGMLFDNWVGPSPNSMGHGYDVWLKDKSTFRITADKKIVGTVDGGNSWQIEWQSDSVGVWSIFQVDSLAWVGSLGSVKRFQNGVWQ